MGSEISAEQVQTSGPARWRQILGWLLAAPFLTIFVLELYYKAPVDSWADWIGRASDAIDSNPTRHGTPASDYALRSIAARCKQRWSSDRSMRSICADRAEAGLADLVRVYLAHLDDPGTKEALTACLANHTTGEVTDFALVGLCARTHQQNHLRQSPMPIRPISPARSIRPIP